MPELSFTTFNLIEAVFWILCGIVTFLAGRRMRVLPHLFWNVATLNFVLFGISDIIEAYVTVGFLDAGGQWLLAWKSACTVIFILCVVWYFKIRITR